MELHANVFEQHGRAIKQHPDKVGRFCIGLAYEEHKSLVFYLGGSLLYYFEDDEARSPAGAILLSGCEADVVEMTDDSDTASFELTAGASWSMVLTAANTEALVDWAVAIAPFLGGEKTQEQRDKEAAAANATGGGARSRGTHGGAGAGGARRAMSVQRFSVVAPAAMVQDGERVSLVTLAAPLASSQHPLRLDGTVSPLDASGPAPLSLSQRLPEGVSAAASAPRPATQSPPAALAVALAGEDESVEDSRQHRGLSSSSAGSLASLSTVGTSPLSRASSAGGSARDMAATMRSSLLSVGVSTLARRRTSLHSHPAGGAGGGSASTVMASIDKIFNAELSFRKQARLAHTNAGFYWRRQSLSSSTASLSDAGTSTPDSFLSVEAVDEDRLAALLNDSPLFHRELEQADDFAVKLAKSRKLTKATNSFLEGANHSVDVLELLASEVESIASAASDDADFLGLGVGEGKGDGSDNAAVVAWVRSWATLVREMQILQSVSLRLLQICFRARLDEQRDRAKEAHEAKRRWDAARVKYAAILQRYLSMGKSKKDDVLRQLEQQLATLKSTLVEEARVAQSKLYLVRASARVDFLERLNDFATIHQSFFRHGWQALQAKEPQMRHLRSKIQSARHQLARHEAHTARRFEEMRSEMLSKEHADPAAMLKITADQGRGLRREGYLLKRDFKNHLLNPRRREWKRRYFVVEEGKLFYRRSAAHDNKPKGTIDLMLTTVRIPAKSDKRFCFELVCKRPEVTYLLQAENEGDKMAWINAIQCTTANLLGIGMPGAGHGDDSGASSGGGTSGGDGGGEMPGMAILTSATGNNVCADCPMEAPEWASINLGITLCLQCSGVHRSLGVHITKVRSLAMDEWPSARLQFMSAVGNTMSNEVWEARADTAMAGAGRLTADASRPDREAFIRKKYAQRLFVDCDGSGANAASDTAGAEELLRLCAIRELSPAEMKRVLGMLARDELQDYAGACDERGRTALHHAALSGNTALTEFLLENGADVGALDQHGQSPLHLAVQGDNVMCVESLLSRGADVEARDLNGADAAQLASGKKCAALLPSSFVDIDTQADLPRKPSPAPASAATPKPAARSTSEPQVTADVHSRSSNRGAAPDTTNGNAGTTTAKATTSAASVPAQVSGAAAQGLKKAASSPSPPPSPSTSHGSAVAAFRYAARRADELSFQKGDMALVLRKDSSGWWEVIINGERGMVPGNYFRVNPKPPPPLSDDDDSD